MLTAGAIFALTAQSIRPGHLFVDRLPADAALLERVRSFADNASYTHAASLLGMLGSLGVLYGYQAVRSATGDKMARDAAVRLGSTLLTFALIVLAASNGLNHMIAHIVNHGAERGRDARTLYEIAVNIQSVKAGMVIFAGYGLLLGFIALGIGLGLRFGRCPCRHLARATVAVALAGLVVLVIGDHFHNLTSLYSAAKYVSMPLYAITAVFGVALYRGHPALAPDPPTPDTGEKAG